MVMKLYKTHGVFYPSTLIEKARNNINRYKWAKDIKQQIEGSAQPWMRFSDDKLWNMMFSCTITRSWMVWSDGYCPNCKNDVRIGLTTKSSVMQPESGLRMEGEMCFVRLSKTEKVHYMCLYGGNFISIANAEARLGEANKFSEIITY